MGKNKSYQTVHKRIPYSTTSIDHQNILSIIGTSGEYEKEIDRKIAQFEKQGTNISTCSEYFDHMINEHTAKLQNKLEVAHANNMRLIGYLFRKRASDKIEFQELLDRLELEIASTEAEYEALKKITDQMNPLKNGRLTAEQVMDSQEEEVPDE